MLTMNSIIYLTYSLIVILFGFYLTIAHFYYENVSYYFEDAKYATTYDYIIVGAGSAGSVLAARLSHAGERVLLLEAGGTSPPFMNIPALTPLLQQTVYDWQYVTVPQKHACRGLSNNQSKWPMGKILGGSSKLNYMAYVRGHKNDYTGWFDDFREPRVIDEGLLTVHNGTWFTELADAILGGVSELGKNVGNINRMIDVGFMKPEFTKTNGERWAMDRLVTKKTKNLDVVTNARVDKVLLENNRAVGVQYMKLKELRTVMALKGVISSAGTVGTAKLLMLSGIGPKRDLERMKINVVRDLPVGQNLMDHVLTGLDLVLLNTTLPLNIWNILNPYSAFDYFFNGQGPWTSAGIEIVGTLHTSRSESLSGPPDLQLMIMPTGISQDNGIALRKAMGIPDETFERYFRKLTSKSAINILPVLLHPKSSGEIKIRSSDPADSPLIDPKYLSVQDDVDVLVEGIRFVQKLIKTNSMQRLGAKLYETHFPNCENYLFDTSDYWECYVRHVTLTSYHPVGTCRIGSVVDQFFRVYRIENLYVVDASVLPVLPSGNTHAAVVMLAEKAARLLINGIFDGRSQCTVSDLFEHVFGVDGVMK